MKDLRKIVVIAAFAVIALTLIFFALPGQFTQLISIAGPYGDKLPMGGYEFIFGGSEKARLLQTLSTNAIVSGAGIAFLILLVVAVVCYVFSKKSSALLLLAGIVMLTSTIMLFCVKSWINTCYPDYKGEGGSVGLWVPYLSASLLAVVTIATLYVAIKEIVKEARQPYAPKKSSYSYLKNK